MLIDEKFKAWDAMHGRAEPPEERWPELDLHSALVAIRMIAEEFIKTASKGEEAFEEGAGLVGSLCELNESPFADSRAGAMLIGMKELGYYLAKTFKPKEPTEMDKRYEEDKRKVIQTLKLETA